MDTGISAQDDGPPSEIEPERERTVVVVRSGVHGRPVAVPAEIVEAAERPYAAYQLHLRGYSWREVAMEMDYLDERAARADVKRYLAEGQALIADTTRVEMLELEVQRLNALQSAVWPAALAGHLPSVNAALSIVVQRAKLLGLDQMAEVEALPGEQAGARTVIVPAEPGGYLRVLKEASGA
jgi:hypothetical protein